MGMRSYTAWGGAAVLLLTDKERAPAPLLAYAKELKPLFTKEPTEGPYNHMYIVDGAGWVSDEQQGDLGHVIEIEAKDGMGNESHMHH